MQEELDEYLKRPTNKSEGYADVPIGRAIDKQRIFRLVQTTIRKIIAGKIDEDEAATRIRRNIEKIAETNQDVYNQEVTDYINRYLEMAFKAEKV